MFRRTCWAFWGWLSPLAALAAGPVEAPAAWLRFRNDLGHAVVIQTSWTANGAGVRGKPQYLHPGETVSEWLNTPQRLRVNVSDARSPRTTILQAEMAPAKGDRSFAVQMGEPRPDQVSVHAVALVESPKGAKGATGKPRAAPHLDKNPRAEPRGESTAKRTPE